MTKIKLKTHSHSSLKACLYHYEITSHAWKHGSYGKKSYAKNN